MEIRGFAGLRRLRRMEVKNGRTLLRETTKSSEAAAQQRRTSDMQQKCSVLRKIERDGALICGPHVLCKVVYDWNIDAWHRSVRRSGRGVMLRRQRVMQPEKSSDILL